MFSFTKDIGMDLGTASVLIYIKDKGIVLNEPSVVAIDKDTGKLLKVGADAQAMLGRTPGNIVAIRPLREGVISDYEVTERMLKEFIHKVMGFQLFKPRIIICVPSGITEVEERAVIDAGIQAGARRVYLIEEPVAAAIGAGIDITQPDGHFIIDIGGGTSDIAVISLSGVVESASIKVAGDQFNEAVVKYMRRKHNLLIGERTAEEMKMSMYENLVMQTQMNYSRYYGTYAAGKTPVRLSDREPLPYEKQIEKLIEKIKEADCIVVGGASGLSSAGGGDFYYEDTPSFRRYFGKFAEKYGFQGAFEGMGYPYKTRGEFWAYLATFLHTTQTVPIREPYLDLDAILQGKDFFILTTFTPARNSWRIKSTLHLRSLIEATILVCFIPVYYLPI